MNALQDETILAAAGWRSVEMGTPNSPYEQFVGRLGFSLQRESLIDPPAGAVGFDLSTPSAGTEFGLRRALYELFLDSHAADTCYAIDVNHGEWTFVPRELKITSHFEPFPVSVTPWAEYVVFGSSDFSHGVFCNPSKSHLIVFGDSFVRRFSNLLRDRLVTD